MRNPNTWKTNGQPLANWTTASSRLAFLCWSFTFLKAFTTTFLVSPHDLNVWTPSRMLLSQKVHPVLFWCFSSHVAPSCCGGWVALLLPKELVISFGVNHRPLAERSLLPRDCLESQPRVVWIRVCLDCVLIASFYYSLCTASKEYCKTLKSFAPEQISTYSIRAPWRSERLHTARDADEW